MNHMPITPKRHSRIDKIENIMNNMGWIFKIKFFVEHLSYIEYLIFRLESNSILMIIYQ